MVDVTDTEEFSITIHRLGVHPLTFSVEAVTALEAGRRALVQYLDEVRSSSSSESSVIIIHTAVGRHAALGAPYRMLSKVAKGGEGITPASETGSHAPVAVTAEDGDNRKVWRVLRYDSGGVKPLVGDRSLSDEHREMLQGYEFTE